MSLHADRYDEPFWIVTQTVIIALINSLLREAF